MVKIQSMSEALNAPILLDFYPSLLDHNHHALLSEIEGMACSTLKTANVGLRSGRHDSRHRSRPDR
ncbi:hypothetical protein NTGM5_750021 [Candidatus Nitrotoga sp. M5]|nr:hypothetical protein NTGM5_750021 [Candidatus Nitrotoga sp. M5]